MAEADLVDSMQADFSLNSGNKFSLAGLYCVPRNKIKALSADQLKLFADRDYLDLLYLHVYSLSNLDKLTERYESTNANAANIEGVVTWLRRLLVPKFYRTLQHHLHQEDRLHNRRFKLAVRVIEVLLSIKSTKPIS